MNWGGGYVKWSDISITYDQTQLGSAAAAVAGILLRHITFFYICKSGAGQLFRKRCQRPIGFIRHYRSALLIPAIQSVFRALTSLSPNPSCLPRGGAWRKAPALKLSVASQISASSQMSDTHWLEIRVSSPNDLQSVELSTRSFKQESPRLSGVKSHKFELSSPWWAIQCA